MSKCGGSYFGNGYSLILVLFILLVIIGVLFIDRGDRGYC